MIFNLKKRQIPIILINGRITKKTFYKWMLIRNFSKKIFSKFNLCFSSDSESKKFLSKLGAKNIINVGNLKFSQTEKDIIEKQNDFKDFVKSKKVWCASSTHYNEEELCGIVHKKLKKKI